MSGAAPPSSSTGLPTGTTGHRVGSIIGRKYRIRRLLGIGGMGAVYKAVNTNIGRTVAIKLLHPHLADDGVALQRFQREARAAAGVQHPGVVEILDMGMHGAAPFIVMEYVRGHATKTVLKRGPFAVEDAVQVAGQLAEALQVVHDRGILHRDLKPENVLLTSAPGIPLQVKVCDFGVAALMEGADAARSELTPTGRAMGTPFYTAPEIIQGRAPRDPRVDVYSIGVLLFEMLTGERPFRSRNLADLCAEIVAGDDPAIDADLPEGLAEVVARAMARDPRDRYPTALALQIALAPFGGPAPQDDPEPTDTFTLDLRDLCRREEAAGTARGVLGDGTISVEVARALREELDDNVPTGVLRRIASMTKLALPEGDGPTSDGALVHLDMADALLGSERTLVASTGRRLATLCRAQGLLPEGIPPELVFASAAELWSRFFDSGQATVREVGRGYGLLEITEQAAPHLARSVLMVGFLDRALMLCGARDVEVRLAEAMALGDPRDGIEASWSV